MKSCLADEKDTDCSCGSVIVSKENQFYYFLFPLVGGLECKMIFGRFRNICLECWRGWPSHHKSRYDISSEIGNIYFREEEKAKTGY